MIAMLRYVVLLFVAGFFIGFGFWNADFAFNAVEYGDGYVFVPLINVYFKAGDFWNLNWLIVFASSIIACYSCFKIGEKIWEVKKKGNVSIR